MPLNAYQSDHVLQGANSAEASVTAQGAMGLVTSLAEAAQASLGHQKHHNHGDAFDQAFEKIKAAKSVLEFFMPFSSG